MEDNAFGEQWLPVSGHDAFFSPRDGRLGVWALVLEARYVPFRVDVNEQGARLVVPPHFVEKAREELRLFEEENRNWPPPPPPLREQEQNTLATVSILLLLAIFHNLTLVSIPVPGQGLVDWIAAGSARAGDIVHGEWWRAVTALTLHSGVVHLISNLLIGGWMMVLLCREIGSGPAWALGLGSGFLGNVANSHFQLPTHSSVGASTAVFGVIGILASLNMVRHRHLPRRWLVPVAGGLALLGALGTEGTQTDIGAHFFGFLAGVSLGLGVAPLRRVPRWVNGLLAVGAGAVLFFAWRIALLSYR